MYHRIKGERDNKNTIHFPPAWCAKVCENASNQACVEICAPRHDSSWFSSKKEISLLSMTRFPLREWMEVMTKEERATSIVIYLAKVVDILQGDMSERENFYHTGSGRVSETFKIQGLHLGKNGKDPDCEDRQKCKD